MVSLIRNFGSNTVSFRRFRGFSPELVPVNRGLFSNTKWNTKSPAVNSFRGISRFRRRRKLKPRQIATDESLWNFDSSISVFLFCWLLLFLRLLVCFCREVDFSRIHQGWTTVTRCWIRSWPLRRTTASGPCEPYQLLGNYSTEAGSYRDFVSVRSSICVSPVVLIFLILV